MNSVERPGSRRLTPATSLPCSTSIRAITNFRSPLLYSPPRPFYRGPELLRGMVAAPGLRRDRMSASTQIQPGHTKAATFSLLRNLFDEIDGTAKAAAAKSAEALSEPGSKGGETTWAGKNVDDGLVRPQEGFRS